MVHEAPLVFRDRCIHGHVVINEVVLCGVPGLYSQWVVSNWSVVTGLDGPF